MNHDMDRRRAQPPLDNLGLAARWRDTEKMCLAALSSRKRRGGDWEPYIVYVVHLAGERLYKVGITREGTKRLRDLNAKDRVIVDTFRAPNGYVARLMEVTVLLEVLPVRRTATSLDWLHGKTECWQDRLEPRALAEVHAQLVPKRPARAWTYSRSFVGTPDGGHVASAGAGEAHGLTTTSA